MMIEIQVPVIQKQITINPTLSQVKIEDKRTNEITK